MTYQNANEKKREWEEKKTGDKFGILDFNFELTMPSWIVHVKERVL